MNTLSFKCEYSGTNYWGFQRQKNGTSIQELLEDALSKYFNNKVTIVASGRTDAGVHAKAQVCSFKIDTAIAESHLFKITTAMNAFLPNDIAVKDFQIAPINFHAQFNAQSKTYVYKCFISPFRSPLREHTHLQIYKPLDTETMKKAAAILLGTHNFKAFCSEQTNKTDFVRTITECKIAETHDEIHFVISGNGFLRNMVRIIVGTLLDVGTGKITAEQFEQILKSEDRKLAGKTAPAHGLILDSVIY